MYPRRGRKEIVFFNQLEKFIPNIKIQSPQIGYFLDGYDETLKIDIEFDEPNHDAKWAKNKDDDRSENLYCYGIRTIRVKEKDWESDPNLEILKIIWNVRNY